MNHSPHPSSRTSMWFVVALCVCAIVTSQTSAVMGRVAEDFDSREWDRVRGLSPGDALTVVTRDRHQTDGVFVAANGRALFVSHLDELPPAPQARLKKLFKQHPDVGVGVVTTNRSFVDGPLGLDRDGVTWEKAKIAGLGQVLQVIGRDEVEEVWRRGRLVTSSHMLRADVDVRDLLESLGGQRSVAVQLANGRRVTGSAGRCEARSFWLTEGADVVAIRYGDIRSVSDPDTGATLAHVDLSTGLATGDRVMIAIGVTVAVFLLALNHGHQ